MKKIRDGIELLEGDTIFINGLQCKLVSFEQNCLKVVVADEEVLNDVVKIHLIQRMKELAGIK